MSLQKNVGKVSLATFCSRIFGLGRDQLFAALIGAGFYADIYVIAFRIPNMLRDLFAEGALSQAFVPTLSQLREKSKPGEVKLFFQHMLAAILMIVGTLTILGFFYTDTIVDMIAPGFSSISGKKEMTILLTQIMLPFLLLVSFASLLMGTLNVHKEFSVPAFAPVFFNITMILFGILIYAIQLQDRSAIILWSIGTLYGGGMQLFVQIPKLRSFDYPLIPKFKAFWKNPNVRKVGYLMIPAIISNSSMQINILVNTNLASRLAEGSPSWLYYAFRLMQFPIGVFGVAISVVTLATVAQNIAQHQTDAFKTNLTQALKLVLILTLPSALGLALLKEPIIALIFERGAFSSFDTTQTGIALFYYSLGLPAYAAVKVLAPPFFTLDDSKIPTMASIFGILVNITFNLSTYQELGHKGLALGTSLGMLCNFLFLILATHFRHHALHLKDVFKMLVVVCIASLSLFLSCYYLPLYFLPQGDTIIFKLIHVLVPISVSVVLYFGLLYTMGISEVTLLANRLLKP